MSAAATSLAAPDSPRTLSEAIRVFFRHASPRILTTGAAVALVARVRVGGWTWWDLAIVAAITCFWPIQEWLIHVFILHYRPIRILGRQIDLPIAAKHREHHVDPWRLETVFIPLHVYPFLLPAHVLFWFGAMPTPSLALTGIAAYLVLGWHYEWVHFLVHTRYTARTWFYRRLAHHHRLHHFKNENYWWGVSMTAGDRLLGTCPDPRRTESSPTCRTLSAS